MQRARTDHKFVLSYARRRVADLRRYTVVQAASQLLKRVVRTAPLRLLLVLAATSWWGNAATAQNPRSPFPFDVKLLDHRSQGASLFCNSLLNDLRNASGISFVEPTAEFETLTEIEAHPPFGHCSLEYLVQLNERTAQQTDADEGLPFEVQWRNGTHYMQTAKFKLYDVDFDGEKGNDREYLLYGADNRMVFGTWDERKFGDKVDLTFITVADLATCRPKLTIQVWDSINSPGTVVGIVNYQNRSLIYETRRWVREGLSTLDFIQFAGKPDQQGPVCEYIARDQQRE